MRHRCVSVTSKKPLPLLKGFNSAISVIPCCQRHPGRCGSSAIERMVACTGKQAFGHDSSGGFPSPRADRMPPTTRCSCPEAAHFRDRGCRVYDHLPSGPIVVKPLACLLSACTERSRLARLPTVVWSREMAETARDSNPNYNFRSIAGTSGLDSLGLLPWSLGVRMSRFCLGFWSKLGSDAMKQRLSAKSGR